MLAQLVSLLESKPDGLSLFEVSRRMKVQPSALQPMLDLLVRKGRLVEIGPDGKCCTACASVSDCRLLAARGKRYVAAR
ncbi:MAG: hypothetical protein DPW18_08590 [Chloroflexi bacterium]|nr:hypothetical protein [Chloroflexota bacterium]MDL1941399.1 hypothetical protein [Chloroflexi bacterium CFX2]